MQSLRIKLSLRSCHIAIMINAGWVHWYIFLYITYMLCLLLLQIAFAGSVMKNYKAMLQQVKDNGVTSEEAFNLAVRLSSEDRYVYFVKSIVQEGINFGWVNMYMYVYITFGCVFATRCQFIWKFCTYCRYSVVLHISCFWKKQAFTKILTKIEIYWKWKISEFLSTKIGKTTSLKCCAITIMSR